MIKPNIKEVIRFNKGDWSIISTPFLGLYNDGIDIYIKQKDLTK